MCHWQILLYQLIKVQRLYTNHCPLVTGTYHGKARDTTTVIRYTKHNKEQFMFAFPVQSTKNTYTQEEHCSKAKYVSRISVSDPNPDPR